MQTFESRHRHIENLRLLNMAQGRERLDDWEFEHLGVCRVCDTVLCVLIQQTTSAPYEAEETSAGAA